jgi:hypothetical protein
MNSSRRRRRRRRRRREQAIKARKLIGKREQEDLKSWCHWAESNITWTESNQSNKKSISGFVFIGFRVRF